MIYPLQMIAWEITDLCNLRCTFCYKGLPEKDKITKEDIDHILKEMPASVKIISLTGGEPTLSRYFGYIVARLSEAKKYVVITTNGIWQNRSALVNFLGRFKKNVQVQVSMEGKKDIHDLMRGKGTYEKIMFTLKECCSKGVKTSIMFTAGKKNVDDLEFLAELAKKYSVNHIGIERLIPTGIGKGLASEVLSPSEFRSLKEKITELNEQGAKIYLNEPVNGIGSNAPVGGCSAANIACAITTKGDVLPCTKLRIESGNVFRDPLLEIWTKSPVLNKLRDRSELKNNCGSCNFKSSCGGCRALAYSITGDYMEEDSYCCIRGEM